ncbi:MAG TPA: type 4a pilus biogenesis protein PilO [Tepidisphaeraceae bacterium]|nr:type 4a pilus biogenesis protein PilO [Tepidisphaeraceae bacterium]
MRVGLREMLFFGAMFALLGCAYFLVFTKADTKRTALLAEVAVKQKALNDVQQSTSGIADLGRKIAELQKAIQFFESKLPQEKEIDKILAETTNKAEENALQIRTVKTLKTEKNAGYTEMPIAMTLVGDFNNYYQFLLELEKLPRLTRVSKMKLEKINDQDGQMEAQMQLSIFFEPEGSKTTTKTTTPASTDTTATAAVQ